MGGFRPSAAGVFESHLAGGVHAEVTAAGLSAASGGDAVALATVGYGGASLEVAEPVAGCAGAVPCDPRVELRHGAVTEWWVTRPGGLEHGWTLREPPARRAPQQRAASEPSIVVAVRQGGVVSVDADGGGAWLTGSEGGLWRYADLSAWDATGAPLTTWIEPDPAGLRVRVDATGARWPITVDPTLLSQGWTQEKLTASGGLPASRFGYYASSAGDVNGDGFDDVLVGAAYASAASVFYGSSAGIDPTSEDALVVASDRRFLTVAGAGDVDGDGFDDVLIGDWSGDEVAHLGYGSASGVDPGSMISFAPTFRISGSGFGWSVAGAGDVNGDGFDDVIVGAPFAWDDDTFYEVGGAWVYYGSASGLDLSSFDVLRASDGQDRAAYGGSVSGIGDVNGDGYDDVLVGATWYADGASRGGAAYVYYGSSSGIDLDSEQRLLASDRTAGAEFGISLSGAGDVDGDGFADIVVGSARGGAYVYLGGGAGIDAASEAKITRAVGDFGYSVSGAGDVDHDGFDEILVGASQSAWLYYGSTAGVAVNTGASIPLTVGAPDPYWVDVATVSDAGDVDGDGYDEVLVGVLYDDDSVGSAFVYARTPAGPVALVDETALGATLDQAVSEAEYPNHTRGTGTGFGDVVGASSTLFVESSECGDLAFAVAFGPGDLNDDVVIYLDTVSGGFASTAALDDSGDRLRKAISGNGSDLSFASGFEADHAIGLSAEYAGLWALSSPSLTFARTLDGPSFPIAADRPSIELGLSLSDIGLSPGDTFAYVLTYTSGDGAYRSNELHGVREADTPADNPGSTALALGPGDFDTFTTVAPAGPATDEDTATVDEGGQVAIDVLDNDSDPSGVEPSSVAIVTLPSAGTATPEADGTISCHPSRRAQ